MLLLPLFVALLTSWEPVFIVSAYARGATEQYSDFNGYFYAFTAAGTVAIIDPSTARIVKTLAVDDVAVSAIDWGCPVYIRDQAQLKHLAFIPDTGGSRVVVIDTDAQSILAKADVGESPMSTTAVHSRDEVWTRSDATGALHVFRTSEARYRDTSIDTSATGHGLVLSAAGLGNVAFATQASAGSVQRIDVDGRTLSAVPLEDADVPCAGTAGIAYLPATGTLLVECVDPSPCANATCTGSLWSVDASSLASTRFTSALLTAKNGYSTGVRGSPVASPDGKYALISDATTQTLFVVFPRKANTTQIIAIPLGATNSPGNIQFWSKDLSGADASLSSNYVAVVALNQLDPSGGIALLDMALVQTAFQTGLATLPLSSLVFISLFDTSSTSTTGSGTRLRPLVRGYDYAATPIYSKNGDTKSLAIVNVRTKRVSSVSIASVTQLLWVPTCTDELAYQITELKRTVAGLRPKDYSHTRKSAHDGLVLAALAFLMAGGALVAIVQIWGKSPRAVPTYDASSTA